MTKEKFTSILKEYSFSNQQIKMLWNTAPANLDEGQLRQTAKAIAPIKDSLVQT